MKIQVQHFYTEDGKESETEVYELDVFALQYPLIAPIVKTYLHSFAKMVISLNTQRTEITLVD